MKIKAWPNKAERDAARRRRDNAMVREWENRVSTYHKWFAWFPVRTNLREFRWLEKVWRRGVVRYSPVMHRYVEWSYWPMED